MCVLDTLCRINLNQKSEPPFHAEEDTTNIETSAV